MEWRRKKDKRMEHIKATSEQAQLATQISIL
jgi:hypothetical protein